jgi:hypothetical protein
MMPSINKIRKTMRDMKIHEDIISALDKAQSSSDSNENCVLFINKMDELLTPEQRNRILERQGCLHTGWFDKAYRAFYQAHSEKTLIEKLELLSSKRDNCGESCRLNEDGTISVFLCPPGLSDRRCECATIKLLEGKPVHVSPTYCGCCAGHIRYHFQHALGKKMKLLRIASTPFDPDGNKGSEFVYEIS